MKHLHITEEAHDIIREFCEERNLKLMPTYSKAAIKGVEAMKREEELQKELIEAKK